MQSKRILLVDDEESVLNTLRRSFRKQPYEIHTATSGSDGLALMSEHSFDLIVSDMRMPEMDGAEFLSKAKEKQPMVERLLLTGYSDMDETVRAINDGGIFGYLSKPWNADQLNALVKSALEKSHKNKLKNRVLKQFKRENEELEVDVERKEKEMAQSAEFFDHATKMMEDNYAVTEHVLLNLVDLKCKGLKVFSLEVAKLAGKAAKKLGFSEKSIKNVMTAGRLHSVGKIGVSDEVLALSKIERSKEQSGEYQLYPLNSACTLMSYAQYQDISQILFEHREYCDGSGYPQGLSAVSLSAEGKLLCLVIDYLELRFGYETGELLSHASSLSVISKRAAKYDDQLMAVATEFSVDIENDEQTVVMKMPLYSLHPGMILTENIYTDSNILLVAKDTALTDSLIEKLLNVEKNSNEQMIVSVSYSTVDLY
jgi:response regulator RpfG family c-di-GMP phosphodiesterase